MKHALKHFLEDLLSTIVFVGLFALTDNALLTTAIAVGVGVAQIAFEKWRGRPVETMQWLSLMLVIVFGGAALVTHDNRFIMVKPTLIQFAVGAVMLKRGWLDRYMPDIVHDMVPRSVVVASGYAWAGLFFAVGIANLVVALECDRATWLLFLSVVPLAAKFAGFGVQYLTFRTIIRRKFRRAPEAYAEYPAAR
jgi:intracellular septation protein